MGDEARNSLGEEPGRSPVGQVLCWVLPTELGPQFLLAVERWAAIPGPFYRGATEAGRGRAAHPESGRGRGKRSSQVPPAILPQSTRGLAHRLWEWGSMCAALSCPVSLCCWGPFCRNFLWNDWWFHSRLFPGAGHPHSWQDRSSPGRGGNSEGDRHQEHVGSASESPPL